MAAPSPVLGMTANILGGFSNYLGQPMSFSNIANATYGGGDGSAYSPGIGNLARLLNRRRPSHFMMRRSRKPKSLEELQMMQGGGEESAP